ncbi:DUF3617 domain-containing protein [Pseudoduganella sp. UC29_71]|jgi:hypothetical protein|uniref:DUF3617 domain-containing protein n=1 Tax=Pseudoduganella sp. UC29_71 TaxID=3350174 RepID=UPI00366DD06A
MPAICPLLRLIPAAALAAVFISPAAAQTIRPGLWEITNKIHSAKGGNASALAAAQKQLANLPPEQRQMVEAMMARQGVALSAGADGGMKLTYCVTREMAEKKELPAGQQGDCKTSQTPIPGGMNISFTCTRPPSSGTGQVLFQGDSAYTMRMNVTGTMQGQQESMTVDSTGRLLSPVCTPKN